MPDTSAATGSIGAFYGEALAESRQTMERMGPSVRRVRLGGRTLTLRFAGDPLADVLFPPLQHGLDDAGGEVDVTIDVWEASAAPQRPARPPWSEADLDPGGLVRDTSGEDGAAVHETGSNAITIVDPDARAILYRVTDHRALEWWERAAPLRIAMCWALRGAQRHVVHAGAVGDDRGSVLLVGAPRSGKTTTVTAALTSGLGLVADDYLLLDVADGPLAHPLYSTVSVAAAPRAEPKEVRSAAGLLCGPLPVRAVVAPSIRGGHTRLSRIQGSAALRAWAPSTALQMPFDGGTVVASVARVIGQVPCFSLEVGDEETAIADAVISVLDQVTA